MSRCQDDGSKQEVPACGTGNDMETDGRTEDMTRMGQRQKTAAAYNSSKQLLLFASRSANRPRSVRRPQMTYNSDDITR